MKTNQILVRYGELSTKGKNRSSFIGRLRDNIRHTFSDLGKLQIQAERDRMFINSDSEEDMQQVIERLPKVSGSSHSALSPKLNYRCRRCRKLQSL